MYHLLTVNKVIAINTVSIDKKSNYIIDEEELSYLFEPENMKGFKKNWL